MEASGSVRAIKSRSGQAVVGRVLVAAGVVAVVAIGLGGAGVGMSRVRAAGQAAPATPEPGIEVFELPGTGDLRGVSCEGDGFCVVTGTSAPTPTAQGSTTTGVIVPIDFDRPGDVRSIAGTSALFGVGCWSKADCLAVGFDGDTGIGQVVPYTNSVPGGPQPIAGTGSLFGADCVSATACLIAGEDASFQKGVVIAWNGSIGRTQDVARTMWQAYCTTADDCLAAGEQGAPAAGVLVATSHGSAGPPQTISGLGALFDVGCMSAADCIAVGGDAKNSVGELVPVTAGQPVGSSPIAGTNVLHGIHCPSRDTCVAVGRSATTASGDYLLIRNGVPGSPRDVPGTSQLEDISCGSPDWCVAVGNSHGQTGVIVEISLSQADPLGSGSTVSEDPFEEFWSILPWLIAILGGIGLLIALIYFGLRMSGLLPNLTGPDGDPTDIVAEVGEMAQAVIDQGQTAGGPSDPSDGSGGSGTAD